MRSPAPWPTHTNASPTQRSGDVGTNWDQNGIYRPYTCGFRNFHMPRKHRLSAHGKRVADLPANLQRHARAKRTVPVIWDALGTKEMVKEKYATPCLGTSLRSISEAHGGLAVDSPDHRLIPFGPRQRVLRKRGSMLPATAGMIHDFGGCSGLRVHCSPRQRG